MTIEQRLEQIEQQNQKIQRPNTRLTVALTMRAVAMCAVVTMAATGEKNAFVEKFDVIKARSIQILNNDDNPVVLIGTAYDAGNFVTLSPMGQTLVELGSDDTFRSEGIITTYGAGQKKSVTLDGKGTVTTYQPNGKELVELGTTQGNHGRVTTFQPNGKELVALGATTNGNGNVMTYQLNGKPLVLLGANDNGGVVEVVNNTGEVITQMAADEYGNGVVWAGNRKGMGRELKPGP
jgi:hypothetical protein